MKNIAKKIVAFAATAALTITSAAALADTLQIGVPDDGTNLSRGIKLLESAGLIEVDPAAGYTPEIKDITKYLYNIEVTPVAANTLPSTLGDFAASTINGTYAVPYGLVPSRDALLIEKQDENGDNPYVNIIVARTADKDNETYKTIVDAYHTQLVAEFLLVNYHETFYPAFEYDADAEFTVTEDNVADLVGYQSSKKDKTVVKVGVCGANNDQWRAVQKVLDDEGANIYIELVEFDAYNLPNEALNSGEIDMNAFQHHAYFNNEVSTNGYDLTAIGDTYIVAMNIYTAKGLTIDDALASTDTLKIAVPNDLTNEGRALKLLESAGFFTIDPEAGASPEISDITDYKVPVEFVEVDANLVYSVIQDVDLAVINGNYALDSGLTADDAIFKESEYADNSYYCLIAVRTEDAENPVYKRIVEAYQTQDTIDIYNDEFKGFFVPAWTLG